MFGGGSESVSRNRVHRDNIESSRRRQVLQYYEKGIALREVIVEFTEEINDRLEVKMLHTI